MKYFPSLLLGAMFASVFLFNFNFNESGLLRSVELPFGDCEVNLGADITISLGDSFEIEAQLSCPISEIASTQWEDNNGTIDCPFIDCTLLTVMPLADNCYTLSITWTDGCVTSDEICFTLNSCEAEYSENSINSISPTQISAQAEIELEIARTQFVRFEIVEDDEVLYEVWEGWLDAGLRNVDLDFSAIPTGSHELRARLYPENISINIEKI